jgi:hypothetical protein
MQGQDTYPLPNLPIPSQADGARYQSDAQSPLPAFVDTGVSLVDKINVDKFLTPP